MFYDRYMYGRILRFLTLLMLKKERKGSLNEKTKRRPRSHSQIMTSALVKIDINFFKFN